MWAKSKDFALFSLFFQKKALTLQCNRKAKHNGRNMLFNNHKKN